MADARLVPKVVRAPRGANVMEIEWGDGHVGKYPHEVLRGYCPCAGCQGHSGSIRFIEGGNTELDVIEEVGNYGLSLGWGDGHSSGIYTYLHLRTLCSCEACAKNSAVQRREVLPR